MTGAEYRRIRKRLGLTSGSARRCFNIDRTTEWRWSKRGLSGHAEELVRVHVRLQEVERALAAARLGIMATLSSGLAADVARELSKPRKRRTKASQRKQADAATEDYLRGGGEVKQG